MSYPSGELSLYLQLEAQLLEVRAAHNDEENPLEDGVLEQMDDAWWKMTQEDRDFLNKAKRVLITSGPVYGRLDDNKLVGNRIRGIWTTHFAEYLLKKGFLVTLLVADTHTKLVGQVLGKARGLLNVITHTGYHDYAAKCYQAAKTHHAAVLGAAVVNWIPAEPIKGKMPTEGFKEGDIINIPFMLAPRVINRMRTINPQLTLIGCKMLIGSTPEELLDAAYHVLLTAKCNVILANDMAGGLREKKLVYPDHSVVTHDNDFEALYADLLAVIDDVHYQSVFQGDSIRGVVEYLSQFDNTVGQYRDRFVKPVAGKDMVFGAVAVRVPGTGWLCSPREKGEAFTAMDAALVRRVKGTEIHLVGDSRKATLNAPLLIRFGEMHNAEVVVHLHEQIEGAPTLPYAPPGTVRDNDRELPDGEPIVNIEGHGCLIKVN